MDKADNDITQRPWPPDSVLSMVGMTRLEWNFMAEGLAQGSERSRDLLLIEAVAQSIVQRRQDGLARVEREA